jgi:hypothetical protein
MCQRLAQHDFEASRVTLEQLLSKAAMDFRAAIDDQLPARDNPAHHVEVLG